LAKTKQIQAAAASWAQWLAKLIRQSTCFLARTHLCIAKRNPSRTASFRNTRI